MNQQIRMIEQALQPYLNNLQMEKLHQTLTRVIEEDSPSEDDDRDFLPIYLAAKRVEKKAVRNDVGEIIGEVSSNLDNMSRVKLVVEGSAVIRCDRLILTNILTNLLDNASRYAPEGSEVKVSLKGRRVTVTNPVKNEMFVPGIGLTVATRMAENIRMTLTMKNDGKLFTAVLK